MGKRRARGAGPEKPAAAPRYESLAAYMAGTGTTQTQLAAAVGIAQPLLSKYIRGSVLPRPHAALRLSKYTGVPVEAMMRARAQHADT